MYLKPIARINISVPIPPTMRAPGANLSSWEIMDKMRELILPDEFVFLRLLKSSGEVYRFEGELESKTIARSCLTRLDNASIRMESTGHEVRLRAADAKLPYPTRTDWETFFRETKGMNETKPGERADTIHIEGLPIRWFQPKFNPMQAVQAVAAAIGAKTLNSSSTATTTDEKENKPSIEILQQVFSAFGEIRSVDIPCLDSPRPPPSSLPNSASAPPETIFDAFIQYSEYIGFVKAMDALRNMKLMLIDESNVAFTASIKVNERSSGEKRRFERCFRSILIERDICPIEWSKSDASNRWKRWNSTNWKKQNSTNRKTKTNDAKRSKGSTKNLFRSFSFSFSSSQIENRVARRQSERFGREQRHHERHASSSKVSERIRNPSLLSSSVRSFREEKRRLKRLERKREHEEKTLAIKIALEERKMLIAHRKLESMRLLEELFNRVKVTKTLRRKFVFTVFFSFSGSNRPRRVDEEGTRTARRPAAESELMLFFVPKCFCVCWDGKKDRPNVRIISSDSIVKEAFWIHRDWFVRRDRYRPFASSPRSADRRFVRPDFSSFREFLATKWNCRDCDRRGRRSKLISRRTTNDENVFVRWSTRFGTFWILLWKCGDRDCDRAQQRFETSGRSRCTDEKSFFKQKRRVLIFSASTHFRTDWRSATETNPSESMSNDWNSRSRTSSGVTSVGFVALEPKQKSFNESVVVGRFLSFAVRSIVSSLRLVVVLLGWLNNVFDSVNWLVELGFFGNFFLELFVNQFDIERAWPPGRRRNSFD